MIIHVLIIYIFSTQLAMVSGKWVNRFERTIEQRSSNYNNIVNGEHSKSNVKQMSWPIPERTKRQLKKMQEAFLNQLFDNGAKSGNKITLHQKKLNKQCVNNSTPRFTFQRQQLPYFLRRAATKKKGEIVEDDDLMINADDCDVFRQMVTILKVKVKAIIMMRSFLPGKQISQEKP